MEVLLRPREHLRNVFMYHVQSPFHSATEAFEFLRSLVEKKNCIKEKRKKYSYKAQINLFSISLCFFIIFFIFFVPLITAA